MSLDPRYKAECCISTHALYSHTPHELVRFGPRFAHICLPPPFFPMHDRSCLLSMSGVFLSQAHCPHIPRATFPIYSTGLRRVDRPSPLPLDAVDHLPILPVALRHTSFFPHLATPCHTLSHLATPCHTSSHLVTSRHTLSHLVTPCHTLSHLVTPCHTSSRAPILNHEAPSDNPVLPSDHAPNSFECILSHLTRVTLCHVSLTRTHSSQRPHPRVLFALPLHVFFFADEQGCSSSKGSPAARGVPSTP